MRPAVESLLFDIETVGTAMDPPFNKLLVLDLDETLVFASTEPLDRPADAQFDRYSVYHRPALRPFLNHVLTRFREVAIWTASGRSYAEAVVRSLPGESAFSFVWSGERCSRGYDYYMHGGSAKKDLRKLVRRGYHREEVLFVDDTPDKISRSYGNYIRIKAFHGETNDRELAHLAHYLDIVGPLPAIRGLEKRHWRSQSQAFDWS